MMETTVAVMAIAIAFMAMPATTGMATVVAEMALAEMAMTVMAVAIEDLVVYLHDEEEGVRELYIYTYIHISLIGSSLF